MEVYKDNPHYFGMRFWIDTMRNYMDIFGCLLLIFPDSLVGSFYLNLLKQNKNVHYDAYSPDALVEFVFHILIKFKYRNL